ncbi:MAG: hypothetical protein V4709_12710 [Pseudomonadota bacterium]
MDAMPAKQFDRQGRAVNGVASPLAQQTAWTPLNRRQSDTGDRKLVKSNPRCWSLQYGRWTGLLPLLPLAIGVVVISRFIPLVGEEGELLPALFLLAMGSFALWMGARGLWASFDTVQLDQTCNRIYPARRYRLTPPEGNREPPRLLSDVGALQLITKMVTGSGKDSRRFLSYELNLVHSGGQRTNLLDHSRREQIEADAVALAGFIGVPLWQMTDL